MSARIGVAVMAVLLALYVVLVGQRAWWVEPDKLLMCQDLFDDEISFRSYAEPVIRALV